MRADAADDLLFQRGLLLFIGGGAALFGQLQQRFKTRLLLFPQRFAELPHFRAELFRVGDLKLQQLLPLLLGQPGEGAPDRGPEAALLPRRRGRRPVNPVRRGRRRTSRRRAGIKPGTESEGGQTGQQIFHAHLNIPPES